MSEIRIMIAAGGTGGHLFPGISISEELSKRPEVRLAFVISSKGVDKNIANELPWEVKVLKAPSISGKSAFKKPFAALATAISVIRAYRMIRKFRPHAVISIGGFIGGPMLLGALLNRVRRVMVEPNAIAGRANRCLGKWADVICVGFKETAAFFPAKKVRVTGNPVRKGIFEVPQDLGNALFVLGGSQGAVGLNHLVADALANLAELGVRLPVIHQTGINDEKWVLDRYKRARVKARVEKFIDDMPAAYGEARFVISRSGAGAVAEIAAAKRPAFFIPFPYAADDHQYANAKSAAVAGGAIVKRECELSSKLLADMLLAIWNDDAKLKNMAEAIGQIASPGAAADVANACMELIGGNK